MSAPKLDELVKNLPPDLQNEVKDFAQHLLETRGKPKQKKLRMSWAGGLREFRSQFKALALQKKALGWWSD